MAVGAKIAVIGVGKMGEYHVGVLSEMREADLVGIVDVNEARARALGEKYEVPWYTDPKELYSKADLVVIAVPTDLHYPIASEFLNAGINVLLEKPCANNLKHARELFKIAESRNLILQIGHVERFNAAVQEMHKIVTEPIYIESKRMSPFPQRIQGDGVVLDIMIHDIDIVLNLVQSRVVKLNVMGTSVFSDKDDVVNAQFVFENGCIGSIVASRASQNKIRTLSVTQKDSYVILDYTDQEIYVHRQASSDYQLTKGSLRYKQESLIERIFVHKENPLKQELKHFIDCVQNGIPRKVAVDNELYSLEIALDILSQL
jgi:predicted dehydrogenase